MCAVLLGTIIHQGCSVATEQGDLLLPGGTGSAGSLRPWLEPRFEMCLLASTDVHPWPWGWC